MFPKTTIAGAATLLAAPIVAIAAALAQPTLSDQPATQVAALTYHRGAMIVGIAGNMIGVVLLIGGIIWLALAPHAPRLALAGGVLGVAGFLFVLAGNGAGAAAPAIVGALSHAQATIALSRVQSAAALAVLGPLSLIGQAGLVLLAIGAATAGARRWAAIAIAIGALGEGAGFATGTKALVIAGFAIMLAGLLQAVRTLAATPRRPPVPETAPAAAVS